MKTHYIKILAVIFFIGSLMNGFAQHEQEEIKEREEQEKREQQSREEDKDIINIVELVNQSLNVKIDPITIKNLKPRWYCPYVVNNQMTRTEVCISNFSIKPVTIRFIIWDETRKMESTFDRIIEGKAQLRFILSFPDRQHFHFKGSMELQADSPAVFPTAHFFEDKVIFRFNDMFEPKAFRHSLPLDWYRVDK